MGGEWRHKHLGEVCTKIGSGATPRGGSDVYLADGPYALIRSQNVYNDGFHHDGLAFISEEHAAQLRAVEVQQGDVLLNITGDSVARACQVDPRVLPARVNQHVAIIRPNGRNLDSRFLRYVLVSPDMQAKLLSWAGAGATRNALTKGMVESLSVLAPDDVAEQRAIAHILGTLDDKIELNRRMNETLEAMARALFKSWFVDFESVGGNKPEDWSYRPLGDLVRLTRGTTYKSSLKDLPGPVLLGLGSIARNGGFRGEKLSTYGGPSPANLILGPGDIYVSLKDVTQSADLLGAVARVPPHIPEGRLTQDTVKLTVKDATTSTHIVYRTLMSDAYREFCRAHATGTTNLGLPREDFLSYPVIDPPEPIKRRFDHALDALEKRASLSNAESRTLAALRDTLLPKLISGELRVNDAETFVAKLA